MKGSRRLATLRSAVAASRGEEEAATARCTYREPDGTECGRVLTDPASVALKLGRVHLRRLVGSVGRRRRVVAVHEGQLVLDLDENDAHGHANTELEAVAAR